MVVHPNNPTGHATGDEERRRLEEICGRHGLALIVDEVFLDYPLGETGLTSFAVGPHPVLTFCLSGMSKIAGLPQMKVGWIVGLGPEKLQREAMGRLEVVADTFLSMNAPVQVALPGWLAGRKGIQGQILERVRGNLRRLREEKGVEVLRVEAGWSAILRLPQMGWDRDVAGSVVAGGGGGGASGVVLWDCRIGTGGGEFIGICTGVCGGFGAHRAWSEIEPRVVTSSCDACKVLDSII